MTRKSPLPTDTRATPSSASRDTGGAPGPDSRVITFAPGLGFNCALLSEGVLGLRQPAEMAALAAPPGAPAWAALRYRDAEGQDWTGVDLALLVREARFSDIVF